MSRFADTSRLAVTEDGEIDPKAVTPDMDVLYLRKAMDYGAQQRVISAALKIAGLGVGQEAAVDVGAYQLALAQVNILDWSGPGFAGRACTPKAIAELDAADPLLARALAIIGARNVAPAPDPNADRAG